MALVLSRALGEKGAKSWSCINFFRLAFDATSRHCLSAAFDQTGLINRLTFAALNEVIHPIVYGYKIEAMVPVVYYIDPYYDGNVVVRKAA